MFIKTQKLEGLLKEAYKGAGINIYNAGDEVRINGGYWQINVKEGMINKENLGTIIKYVGKIPPPGQGFSYTKDGAQGYFDTEYLQRGIDKYPIKGRLAIGFEKNTIRLLRNEKGTIYPAYENIINTIDLSMLEPGEEIPGGPFGTEKGIVYWKNERMTLCTSVALDDDQKTLIAHLEQIPAEIY